MNNITLSIILECKKADKAKQIASLCSEAVELVIMTSKAVKDIKAIEDNTKAKITVIKHTAKESIDEQKKAAIKAAAGEYVTFIETQDEVAGCYASTIIKTIEQTNGLDYIKLFWCLKSWKNRCFYGCNNMWATFSNVYRKEFAAKLNYSETPEAEEANNALMNEAKSDAIMTKQPLYFHYDRKGEQ